MVRADASDVDILFVVSALDAYVSICVRLDDWEGSFSRRGDFCFSFPFVGFLYYEHKISDFVFVWYPVLVLFLVVGDGLGTSLMFEKLPVDSGLLAENHVDSKDELARVVRSIGGYCSSDCPSTGL